MEFWRGGRVVDCGGLENRCTARYPGFESLSLRKLLKIKHLQERPIIIYSRTFFIFIQYSTSFHPSILHFFSIFIILLTLTSRKASQRYANHSCTMNTSLDCIVESLHVLGQKTLTYQLESMYLFIVICHKFRFSKGYCRTILKRKSTIFRPNRRLAFRDSRKAYLWMYSQCIELITFRRTMKIPHIVASTSQRERHTIGRAIRPCKTYSNVRSLAHYFQRPIATHFSAYFSHILFSI